MAIGLVVMFGWFANVDLLKSILPNWTSMKFSTALSFLMTGIIIYLLAEQRHTNSDLAKILIPAPIVVILFFMVTFLVSNVSGITTGIENILVTEHNAAGTVVPGRPSITTMINFILIVITSLYLLISQKSRQKFVTGIGLILLANSTFAILGYITNLQSMRYEVGNFSSGMAIHTAFTFMIVGIAFVFLTKIIPQKTVTKKVSIQTKIITIILASLVPIILVSSLNYSSSQQLVFAIPQFVTIIVFSVIIGTFISKSVAEPVKLLKNSADKIAKGDIITKIEFLQNDEIGELAKDFELMREQIQARTIDLEKANAVLKQKDRQKDEFSTMIVHELKTPLTPIKGYADLLLSKQLGSLNDAQEKRLVIIKENAELLLRLITDLVSVEKLELGRLRLTLEENNLADIINNVLVNLRSITDKNDIIVTTTLQQNIICVCDKARIEQVLSNLLYNAIDFCPKSNGRINIILDSEERFAKMVIEDNGAGMPEDKLEKIFTKFYQIDSSTTREYGGTGVGLSVCKGIVEEHGGKIWTVSKLGHGSKFHILLPKNTQSHKNTELQFDEKKKEIIQPS